MIDLQPVIDSLKAELAKVDAGIEAMECLQAFRQRHSPGALGSPMESITGCAGAVVGAVGTPALVDLPAGTPRFCDLSRPYPAMLPAKPDQQKGCSRCPEVNGIGKRCDLGLGHDGAHMTMAGEIPVHFGSM